MAEPGRASCAGDGSPTPERAVSCRARPTPGPTCTAASVPAEPSTPMGLLGTRTTELPRSEWPVLILDHHEGYISWEQFLTIEAKLAANRTTTGARPPREGGALCQGIVFCGACGRAMSTYSAGGHDYYDCAHARQDHTATTSCRSVRSDTVDAAVSDCLLSAVSGEELTLALAAADEVTERRARSTRAAELAVERAKYQADRAERALLAVEPENRLVARTFENRLEARLAELAEAEAALATQRAATAPLPPRAELEAVVTNLGELWAAPTTSNGDRKRLLRTLIANVTLSLTSTGRSCASGSTGVQAQPKSWWCNA